MREAPRHSLITLHDETDSSRKSVSVNPLREVGMTVPHVHNAH